MVMAAFIAVAGPLVKEDYRNLSAARYFGFLGLEKLAALKRNILTQKVERWGVFVHDFSFFANLGSSSDDLGSFHPRLPWDSLCSFGKVSCILLGYRQMKNIGV